MNGELKFNVKAEIYPLMPVEVARDLWLNLRRGPQPLSKTEHELYEAITKRFLTMAQIESVEITHN